MQPFAVYYGWPSSVNGADGDVGRAIAAFDGLRAVVFGDDCATSVGDALAGPIMAGIVARGGAPYGYVSVGVTHGEPNHPLEELHARIDAWCRLGARGLLIDCAGADYGVSRARFDAVVRYPHTYGLHVLSNAWDCDDVLAASETLGPGDGYLGENDVLCDGQLLDPRTYEPKLARMARYKADLGVTLYATATTRDPRRGHVLADRVLTVLRTYGVDAFQLTDPLYSAADNVLAAPPAALAGRS